MSDAAGLGGAPVPDAPAGNWVDRLAPPRSRPFLRLARADRPIGWWLLLLPCWWATALATEISGGGLPSPVLLALGVPPETAQTAVRFTFGRAPLPDGSAAQLAALVAASVTAVAG